MEEKILKNLKSYSIVLNSLFNDQGVSDLGGEGSSLSVVGGRTDKRRVVEEMTTRWMEKHRKTHRDR